MVAHLNNEAFIMQQPTYDEYGYDLVPLEPAGKKYVYDYPRPSVTTDVVVFAEDDSFYEELKVLLIKRGNKTEACPDMWALPGGYMEIDEELKVAAVRELHEETGIYLTQYDLNLVGVYDKVDRDKRGRVLTVAYYATTYDKQNVRPKKGFEHEISDYKWIKVLTDVFNTDMELAFDHRRIIMDAYNQYSER